MVANEIWWNILVWGEYWCIKRGSGIKAKGNLVADEIWWNILVDMGVKMISNDVKLEDIHNMDYANLRKFGCKWKW